MTTSASPLLTRSGVRQAFFDLGAATCYLLFAYAHVRSFLATPRASMLLVVVTETLFAVFFLLRKDADRTSGRPADWLAAFLGTLLPLLLRPSAALHDLPLAQVIQVIGTTGSVAGILSLNRSVSVVPSHREVRTTGAYRLVRHPLYASYLVGNVGYVLSNQSARNLVVLVAATLFQLVRIQAEERLLQEFADYRAYRQRTRWRLIPFVF